MIFPVFEVPGFHHVTNKPQEPLVLDFLRQYPEKDLVVKRPEAVGDISFDKPYGPGPGIVDLPQCGMASAPFPEPVRQVRESWLVVCLKKQAHHLADEFI